MRKPENVAINLLLALIPVLLGFLVAHVARDARRRGQPIPWLAEGPLLFIWLIFLPNTCYLLTEWRHFLESIATQPMVFFTARYDEQALFNFLLLSIFYVAYSGSGVLMFFLAIWPVDRVFNVRLWGRAVFFLLCSLGVYLGLIKRFNSWEVARHAGAIARSTLHALARPELDLLIVGFALILWLAYVCFELFMDGLMLRQRRLTAK